MRFVHNIELSSEPNPPASAAVAAIGSEYQIFSNLSNRITRRNSTHAPQIFKRGGKKYIHSFLPCENFPVRQKTPLVFEELLLIILFKIYYIASRKMSWEL
jgi:hypothetical protein